QARANCPADHAAQGLFKGVHQGRMPGDLGENRMKSASLVCLLLAAAMFSGAAGGQKLREPEATAKLYLKERIKIEANIDRLKYCVARNRGCSVDGFPRLLLGLTRSEVEAILGPPQYHLHLAGKHLYYWT